MRKCSMNEQMSVNGWSKELARMRLPLKSLNQQVFVFFWTWNQIDLLFWNGSRLGFSVKCVKESGKSWRAFPAERINLMLKLFLIAGDGVCKLSRGKNEPVHTEHRVYLPL